MKVERARKWVCQMQAHACTHLFGSQHSHSRYVDHSSDAMIDCVPETAHRIRDGGSLLHRIPWQHGTILWKYSESLREEESDATKKGQEKSTEETRIGGTIGQEGERRKSYSAAVIDGIKRNTRI